MSCPSSHRVLVPAWMQCFIFSFASFSYVDLQSIFLIGFHNVNEKVSIGFLLPLIFTSVTSIYQQEIQQKIGMDVIDLCAPLCQFSGFFLQPLFYVTFICLAACASIFCRNLKCYQLKSSSVFLGNLCDGTSSSLHLY